MGAFTGERLSTTERLRELAWEGFTPQEIAAAAGCPVDAIEDLYATGTGRRGSCNAVMRAWRKLIPLDVDQVAVERVLDGDYPPQALNPGERREAARQLLLCRHTHREIAERLAIHPRQATRIIVALGHAEQGAVTV